jgi:hypothetical protein
MSSSPSPLPPPPESATRPPATTSSRSSESAPETSAKPARSQPRRLKTLPPLSALTYYRRNVARTLPVGGAIILSVFLIAGIVSLLNSVDRSITTNYGFTRHMSVLTTQLIKEVPPRVEARARKVPQAGRVISAIPYVRAIKTVFGQMPVPIYGVDESEAAVLAQVSGNRLVAGRWPRAGEPEVVLSRAWANNYGVGIGGLIGPTDENLPTLPSKQRVVGILEGGDNLAIADKDYLLLELPEPVIRPSLLFLPREAGQMDAMNAAIRAIIDEPQKAGLAKGEVQYVKFYTFDGLVKQLRDTLGFLYQFLTFADALVIGAVALLSGFLANIYFDQRLGEFGLLSAFGFRRERLARRVIVETGSLVVIGWLIGLGLIVVGFQVLDALYMAPRGLVLAMPDASALAYTAPIPILVGIASLATVLLRLYRTDPIEIMERR